MHQMTLLFSYGAKFFLGKWAKVPYKIVPQGGLQGCTVPMLNRRPLKQVTNLDRDTIENFFGFFSEFES